MGYDPPGRETRRGTKRLLIRGNKVVRQREKEQRSSEEGKMGHLRREGTNTQERERGGRGSGSRDQTSSKARSGVSQLKG